MSVKAYFQLIRIHNVVGSAISAFMGFVVASNWSINPIKLVVSMLVVALVAAGGYVINDIYDIEIDRINKPYRPLPSGKISIRKAFIITWSTFIIGALFSAILGVYPFILALVTIILLVFYAKKLKKEGIVGNFVVALTSALSAFYGGLAYFNGNWFYRVIIPTLFIFFFTLSREFIKGIEDVIGDKENGVKTLAVKLGITRTWTISKIILLLLLITSPIPFFLGFSIIYLLGIISLDSILAYIIFLENTIESASKARSLMKIYALGTLVLFALGSLRI